MVMQRLARWLFGDSIARKSSESASAGPDVSESNAQEPVDMAPPSWHKYATDPKPMLTYDDAIEGQARRIVELVNESLDIVQNSSDPETRISRVDFAEQKLQELLELSAQHPRIKTQHVAGVRGEIERLRSIFTATVSFSSDDLLRSQGALAEVDGKPTHQLAERKHDLDVMQACMRAEIENYWRQLEGHRLTAVPYFFERVAILQRKVKSYKDEVAACEAWSQIVEDYKSQSFVKNGSGAKVWLRPRSIKIGERLPKARELLARQIRRREA